MQIFHRVLKNSDLKKMNKYILKVRPINPTNRYYTDMLGLSFKDSNTVVLVYAYN